MRCLPCLLLIVFAATIYAAPAPIAAPPAVHKIDGSWRLQWGIGLAYHPATFLPNGSFGCFYGGELWTGTWVLTGDALTVTEARPDGHTITWTATLEAPIRGKVGCVGELAGGGAFRLRGK